MVWLCGTERRVLIRKLSGKVLTLPCARFPMLSMEFRPRIKLDYSDHTSTSKLDRC